MMTPRELQLHYNAGENISALLRKEQGLCHNTKDIIEIAYDLQTGSYTAAMDDPAYAAHKHRYCAEIATTLKSLCTPETILEAGVGEATTLSSIMRHFSSDIDVYGFDLSWSRVAYAKRWLRSQNLSRIRLCTGDLFQIPIADNAIDIVFTSHAIEPNGGQEQPILSELLRISKKFLVLLEPAYEFCSDDLRRRMDSHGYCKNLKGVAESLGALVVTHELFPIPSDPRNPTALLILQKVGDTPPSSHVLACPRFKSPLQQVGEMMYSPEALVMYPIVAGIPCLRWENSILASKYMEFLEEL